MISCLPCTTIQIIFIRNLYESIDEFQSVFRAKSLNHGTTPCEVIGAIQRRSNKNGVWSFTRMNIKHLFNIRLCLARHGEKQRRRRKLQRFCKKNEEGARTSKKICEESMNNARIFCKKDEESMKKMKNETVTNFVTNFLHGREAKGS